MEEPFVYKDLSYKINGCLFEVYNALGAGLKEKTYQDALAVVFSEQGLIFEREVRLPILFHEMNVGTSILDFLVNNSIVVELKIGEYYSRKNMEQILEYLKAHDLKLGLLANFTREGVRIKRIVNIR
ncbi:TPA: GxxExxY protein [Candidatus Uhrbacteria bacterium]|nr:MAG: hypothetical protein A3D69_00555 [Candidatus Uhrbacteria bacterium RIFCSPHIGHO2_02_FULL_54_11]HBL39366.1 GxxExxY protein [Candidatus Uhrbacteria bacterium]